MSVNQNIRSCLNCRTPESLPVFLFTPPFDLRVLGYTHSDYAANAETMVEVHTEAVKRFGYHWTFLHVDNCAALGPLGIEAGPADPLSVLPWTPYKHLPANRKTLAGLAVPDPLIAGRMPLALLPLKRLVADIAAEGGWGLYHQNEPEREYIAASAEAFGGGAVNIGQGAIVQEVAAASAHWRSTGPSASRTLQSRRSAQMISDIPPMRIPLPGDPVDTVAHPAHSRPSLQTEYGREKIPEIRGE